MENNNVIYGINGPVVTVKNTDSFEMMEMVHVGKQKLVGEIIGITDDITTIQVYEETTGLKPGDPVEGTGAPMNVLLKKKQVRLLTVVLRFLLLMTRSCGMLQ